MGWLRLFRENGREYREEMGFSRWRHFLDSALAVMAFLAIIIDLGVALLIQGGK